MFLRFILFLLQQLFSISERPDRATIITDQVYLLQEIERFMKVTMHKEIKLNCFVMS